MKNKTSFKKGHKPTCIKTGKEHGRYVHGMYGTPLYKKWESMKRRCLNKNEKCYPRYGGRGITVCDKWLDFMGFYEDMNKSFKKGLSLERIDNNKGYSPENCKWIPLADQSKNKRNVPFYEFNGLKMTASDWDRKLGLKDGTFWARMKMYGWSVERAAKTDKTASRGFFKDNRNLYRVEVRRNGKRHFVGRYISEKEAENAHRDFLAGLLGNT